MTIGRPPKTYGMKSLCWDIPARINGIDIFMNAIRGKNTEELLVGAMPDGC